MQVYILLCMAVIFFCTLLEFVQELPTRTLISLFVFLFLWIVSSLRYYVGADYISYYNFYYNAVSFTLEPVYHIVRGVFVFFNLPVTCFFSFFSFITLAFFFKSIFKYSVSIELSLVLFVLLGFYTNSFNIMRQLVALSLFFTYGYKYIIESNFKKYLIAILIISLFHFSVLFMLPFYFLAKKNYGVILGSLILMLAIAFNMGVLNVTFINFFLKFLPQNYAGYLQFLEYYLGQIKEPLWYKLVSNIDKLIIIFLLLTNKQKLIQQNSSNLILINFYLFYAVFSFATRGLEELQRLSFYFSVFSILSIPLLVTLIPGRFPQLFCRLLVMGVYLGWFIFFVLQKNYGSIIPYKSVL